MINPHEQEGAGNRPGSLYDWWTEGPCPVWMLSISESIEYYGSAKAVPQNQKERFNISESDWTMWEKRVRAAQAERMRRGENGGQSNG